MFRIMMCSMMFMAIAIGSAVANDVAGKANMIREIYMPVVKKAMPDADLSFEKSFKHTFGVNDAKAAINLIGSVRSKAEKLTESTTRVSIADAYRASWNVGLHIWRNSRDEKAREIILQEWERSLKEEGRYIPLQICALCEEWDRTFLTEEFWRSLEQIREKETITAICYVLYEKGNKQDLEKLLSARKTVKNTEIAQTLQNAIDWIRHRDEPDNPGPASAPPRIVRTLAKAEDMELENVEGHRDRVSHAERLRKERQERQNER